MKEIIIGMIFGVLFASAFTLAVAISTEKNQVTWEMQ